MSRRTHLKVVKQEAVETSLKAARFQFHERVLADPTLSRAAIRLAGYVMHQFKTKDGMSFSFSLRQAAKYLKANRGTVKRGMALLERRGHLYRLNRERINAKGAFNPTGRYAFGNPIKDTGAEMSPGGAEMSSGTGAEMSSLFLLRVLRIFPEGRGLPKRGQHCGRRAFCDERGNGEHERRREQQDRETRQSRRHQGRGRDVVRALRLHLCRHPRR